MNHSSFIEHFEKVDSEIAGLINNHGEIHLPVRVDYYEALLRSIIGQQVSVKAADSVYAKLRARYNDILDPSILRDASKEELREAGISRQKAGYINDLSDKFLTDTARFERLHKLGDQEVIDSLTTIKGIGVWTAQMFLMFTLRRLDVFPVDDLAIRNAMIGIYGWKKEKKRPEFTKYAECWAPYRSVACWYLWKSLH
jgi:DNA-3-methyladenine glycosylase II